MGALTSSTHPWLRHTLSLSVIWSDCVSHMCFCCGLNNLAVNWDVTDLEFCICCLMLDLYLLPNTGNIWISCLISTIFVSKKLLQSPAAQRLHRHSPSDEFYHFLGTLVFDERQPCQTDMCHMVPNCPHCPIACARSLRCWIVFSCPEQLNRTPCLSGTTSNQSLHNTTEWPQRLVTPETFDQRD